MPNDNCKLIIDRPCFAEALTLASRVVRNNSPKPELACILLEAEEGVLKIKASDTEFGVSCTVRRVEVAQPGTMLLPASELLSIVKGCTGATITIEAKADQATIIDDNATFNLFGHPPTNYPPIEFETEDEHEAELPVHQLQHQLNVTVLATARENSRYAINGVLMDYSGTTLTLVATDGHRLSLSKAKVKTRPPTMRILPSSACRLLLSAMNDPEASVRVSFSEWRAFFDLGEVKISTALVSGNFPPYEDVIPKSNNKHAVIEVDALSAGIARASVLTTGESKGVRFSFDGDGLVLSSRAPEIGESSIRIPVESYDGDPIEIGANPSYVLSSLKNCTAKTVRMSMHGANKPIVITDGDDVHVAMPVNLQ